jgi:hypothetical protein
MPSRYLALCLFGLIGTGAYWDEPPKPLAEQIAAIKKEYQDLEKKFYADLTTFRNDDKKVSDLNRDYHASQRKQSDKLKELIRAHGKEPDVFEGFLVLVGDMRSYLDEDMVPLIQQHHAANPKMGQFCFALMYRSEAWAEKLLKEAAAKHPEQAARGQATYALGMYYRYRAQPWGKTLPEEEEAKLLAEAQQQFTEVAKTYAAVTTPDGKAKLGDLAASQLTRLKNLPSLKVGKVAPEIEGEDLDGKAFKLSDYRGKVVLLDFWGHW